MTASSRRSEQSADFPPHIGRELNDVGNWELLFAWRPVRLYGGVRLAWVRRVSRRYVLTGRKHLRTEYTDTPSDFPAGYGLESR